jgi:plastocyanin
VRILRSASPSSVENRTSRDRRINPNREQQGGCAVIGRRLRAQILVGGVLALLGVAMLGGGAALAADHAVAISGFAFSPKTITVTVGDTVTWTNSDSTAHTATADDGSFDTGTVGNGATGSATFATAGTFAYHCKIHASMTGTITVEAAASGSGGSGGSGATTPPSDTVAATAPPVAWDKIGVALVIVGAFLVGLALAGRRFARD